MFFPLVLPSGVRALRSTPFFACATLLALGWGCLLRPGLVQAQNGTAVPQPARRLSPEQKRTLNGRFRRLCAGCHGRDFTGDSVRTPDFTDKGWHRRRSDAQLLVTILEGKGAEMPAYHGKVSEDEARQLVALIRDAGGVPLQPAESAPDDFSRRFAELEMELKELQRQFRELRATARQPEPKVRPPTTASPRRRISS
jgi:mono/diheme cytochrome c family protein